MEGSRLQYVLYLDGETQWIKYDRENNELTLDGLTYRLKSKIDPKRDRKSYLRQFFARPEVINISTSTTFLIR